MKQQQNIQFDNNYIKEKYLKIRNMYVNYKIYFKFPNDFCFHIMHLRINTSIEFTRAYC